MAITQPSNIERNGKRARILRVRVEGIVSDEDVKQLKEELTGYRTPENSSYDPTALYCFDLESVGFITATSLGTFINFNKWHKQERGRAIAFANAPRNVYEVFCITKLNRLFHFHGSIDDYLNSL